MREPIGYVALVRGNRNYRNLWFGQIVSLLGDWFNLIASATLIASLTQSGVAVGSLFLVRMLAPFLVSPIAGVVADRYDRKTILILADIGRAATAFCFLLVREPGQVWLLYALTAVQLGLSGFFFPTRNAILPDIVSRRELGAANALSAATWSVMLSLGAALGGIVSGTWGIYPAFAIDGLTFLVSAVFIARVRTSVARALDASSKTLRAAFQQYLEGVRFLRSYPAILAISLHKSVLGLLSASSFEIIEVTIADRVFPIGEGGSVGLGFMFMMTGIGSGLGPLLARRFTKDRVRLLSLAILAGYGLMVAGYLVVAPLYTFGTTLLGILIRALGSGVVWVFSTQLLLQLVPGRIRGRIFASEFAFFTLMGAFGAILVGSALDASIGLFSLIATLAGLTLLPATLWAFWLGRNRALTPVEE
jgi:MFS family permease